VTEIGGMVCCVGRRIERLAREALCCGSTARLDHCGPGLEHSSSEWFLRRCCSGACEGGTRRLLDELAVAVRQGGAASGVQATGAAPDLRLLRGFRRIPGWTGCGPPW